MTVIFPVNGKGERFKKAAFNIPKPLLPLPQDRIVDRVTETYRREGWRVLTLLRREWCTDKMIKRTTPILWDTSGPLETLLSVAALESLEDEEILLADEEILLANEEILLADCDSFFEDPQELWSAVEEFRKANAAGGVTIRRTKDPGCSYAQVTNGFVHDFREKDPFTEWSTTGPYYWKNWITFYRCALQAYWDGVTSIAPVYNYLKEPVWAVEVKTFVHLGTPEEYISYCQNTAKNR